jgi:hypothetical protein
LHDSATRVHREDPKIGRRNFITRSRLVSEARISLNNGFTHSPRLSEKNDDLFFSMETPVSFHERNWNCASRPSQLPLATSMQVAASVNGQEKDPAGMTRDGKSWLQERDEELSAARAYNITLVLGVKGEGCGMRSVRCA